MYARCVQVSLEDKRHQVPWNWSYRVMSHPVSALGELVASGRAAGILNCRVSPPAPRVEFYSRFSRVKIGTIVTAASQGDGQFRSDAGREESM